MFLLVLSLLLCVVCGCDSEVDDVVVGCIYVDVYGVGADVADVVMIDIIYADVARYAIVRGDVGDV